MVNFHKKTLQLLNETDHALEPLSEEKLSEIAVQAEALGVTVPAAYWQYLAFGGVEVLFELSNSDDFPILELMTLPDGRQGLMFHMENSGNFQKCCLLNEGDNPPVLYGWLGDAPWIDFSATFSEAIYTQVFDWQLQVSGHGYGTHVAVNDIFCLDLLSQRFTAVTPTHYIIEDDRSTEWRYVSEDNGRIHLFFRDDHQKLDDDGTKAVVNIYHANQQAGERLHSQVLETLQSYLVPRRFFCPHKPEDVIEYLEDKLTKGLLTHIQFCCVQQPSLAVLQAMKKANTKKPFTKRGAGFVFAWSQYWNNKNTPNYEKIGTVKAYIRFGGKAWGGMICLRQLSNSWYVFDKIEAC